MERKLCKTRRGNKIDGVCNGIATYIGIDVTIIRLLFVIFAVCGGSTIILYIVCMFIMPRESDIIDYTDNEEQ